MYVVLKRQLFVDKRFRLDCTNLMLIELAIVLWPRPLRTTPKSEKGRAAQLRQLCIALARIRKI